MIPKIIHYCWLSNDPYPEGIQACLYSWKKHLPDYEFKLWNFSSFDIESSQWVKTAFYAGKYAFAADYIRAFVETERAEDIKNELFKEETSHE